MSHQCKNLVVHCIDFRFINGIHAFLEEDGLAGDTDIVALAGAAKNIASPLNEIHKETLLAQIDISIRLHAISTVHFINHLDCGAYGGSTAFADEENERAAHSRELAQAAELVRQKFPSLAVKTYVASFSSDTSVSIDAVSVEDSLSTQ